MKITTQDGRTILTDEDYTEFRHYMWERSDKRCGICGWLTDLTFPPEDDRSFHVHHRKGRGIGGSKRDDTWDACIGLCGNCHKTEHNQQWSKAKLAFKRSNE